ncbi:MAG: CPBP family intramembrane glutamic endopeptidase [Steroidobacter sp.]
MRSFLLFLALLAVSLVAAAALTYPAWLLVSTISVEPVHRVMNRVAMLFALIGLIYLTRRLGLSDRTSMGYGLPRRKFLRQLTIGWLCGVGLMTPLAALLLGLDIRQLKPDFDGSFLALLAGGVVSGLAVAFIEETFFRGVLFTAISRTSGVVAATLAPSVLYAGLHFLGGRLRVPADEVTWVHGFAVLSKLFERYAEPLKFADSFIALAMLGVLLCIVRLRTGAIAACIGLHAAGVCAIAVLREATLVNQSSEFAVLVGAYDGVIGWAALIWFAMISLGYVLLGRRNAARTAASILSQ